MSDPQWAKDLNKDEIELWKERAKAQLERARKAESELEEVKSENLHLKVNSTVLSIGKTVEEAVQNYEDFEAIDSIDPEIDNSINVADRFDWGGKVKADGMTFDVCGRFVPGGAVLTYIH